MSKGFVKKAGSALFTIYGFVKLMLFVTFAGALWTTIGITAVALLMWVGSKIPGVGYIDRGAYYENMR